MAITKVTTDVITDGAVTAPKLATDSVTADKLAANSVTAAKIAAGTLTDQVANNSITAAKIPNATALTLDGGVTIDNINIDGTTIALSSGDLTLDVAGDITFDAGGGDILFKDDGTLVGTIGGFAGSNVTIKSEVSDGDVIIQGNDGGSGITALTLDMSEAGAATFNSSVNATNYLVGGAQGSDGQVLTSTGSGVAWEDASSFNADAAQTFNESGADVNFRIESDGLEYMFFVDAGNNRVAINHDAPSGIFHVAGHTSSIASIFESNGNGDTVPLQLKVKANNGTTSTQGLYGNAGSASTDNTITLGTDGATGLTIDNLGNLKSSQTGGHVQIDNGIGVTVRETMAATGHAWQSNTYNVLSAGSTSIGTDSTGTTHMWFNSYDTGSKYSVKAGHSADLYHGITDGQFVLRMSSNSTTTNGEGITMLQRLYIDKDGTFQFHSAGTNDTTIKFYKGASTIKWWMQNDTGGSPGSDAFWIGDEENDNGVYVVQDGSSWQGISDERLKRNWTNLENATDKIKTLTKVGTFQRRGKTTGNWSDNREVGLSAQEVEAILPEAVTTGGDIEFASDDKVTGVKGMAYEKLVPLLVKSIQELEARIKTLEG